MNDDNTQSSDMNEPGDSVESQRLWRPLNRRQRRVLGVLVEKAKTTPDAYPMTLNGITTGCNQKSNRAPQMTLAADDVELLLEELREMGAVIEKHGGGRVAKFKHLAYEWLAVDKVELAVMAELLLRGEQTLGELRSRASRMEPITDLGSLRPIIDSLLEKGLMVELSPAGRGQVVTHNLYEEPEMKRLRETHAEGAPVAPRSSGGVASERAPASRPAIDDETRTLLERMQEEIADLRARVESIESELR